MDDDDFKPRKDDHLVEPFFAGLDRGREPVVERRGCFAAAALLLGLALLLL